jgi:hypothetical protein
MQNCKSDELEEFKFKYLFPFNRDRFSKAEAQIKDL